MFWCSPEQDEMVKVIYKIVDNNESHYPDTEEEDAETRLEAQHTGGDTAWSRWYRLIAVFLVMLCLLLTAIIVLWIKYPNLKESQTRWNYTNSSVYIIINEQKSWTESRKNCRETGADLVIITSREEQEFVTKLRAGGRAWIGLSNREGEWKWVDDTTLITGFWGDKEPNSAAREDRCVITRKTSDPVKNWGDVLCNKTYNWICEKKIFN
ncbi:C-type lectin domain family 4 member E-like [Clarias gariepinus]|uniref:C-type lectin domain family 4 member E-like n=1 Tax=Clarias gariepinus TaxID=13013 RepID=UPI00234D4BAC|nr:C-type lectin domain family 4 member E-like [Clarias gariepinus]